MSVKENWKNLNTNEKVTLGAFAVLMVVLIARWDKISKAFADGLRKLFGN